MKAVGSRAEVFHGNAKRTSGRLKKEDLMKNKAGRIVSKQKHAAGKVALKYLHAKGYIAVKGKFGSARKVETPTKVSSESPNTVEVAVADLVVAGGAGTDVAVAPVATSSVAPDT